MLLIMKMCPFGCSHHTFPDNFNFCHFCGSKLTSEKEIKNNCGKIGVVPKKSKRSTLKVTLDT